MEMMRHPDETTNMRRQTVASYFRVGVFFPQLFPQQATILIVIMYFSVFNQNI